MAQIFDVVIVGGGIVGLTIARSLVRKGILNIAILEKEAGLGFHASGRNSGVLHAGFYYSEDSLKAKLCAQGSRMMYEYAIENGISVSKSGKVVVATRPEDVEQYQVLLSRAQRYGIDLRKISLQELAEIEPEAASFEGALYSPNTAVIDSKQVLETLSKELLNAGVKIFMGLEAIAVDVKQKTLKTNVETFNFGFLVNAAGMYADQIAHQCQVGKDYCILPFKGVYRKLNPEAAARFRGSIYPVPDLRMPFLGVHVTRNIHGEVYVGPTAIPAFGRENYSVFSGIEAGEGLRIAGRLLNMISKNTQGLALSISNEIGRYSDRGFLKAARQVSPALKLHDLLPTGKVGLRAQLFNKRTAKLEMDFVVEDGENSIHVLNAVSPAFSASLAFADMLAERIHATFTFGR